MATCKGCGAEIIWRKMISGKNMPVDAEGITVVVEGTNEGYENRWFTTIGYTPHWSTCPKADQFRGGSKHDKSNDGRGKENHTDDHV